MSSKFVGWAKGNIRVDDWVTFRQVEDVPENAHSKASQFSTFDFEGHWILFSDTEIKYNKSKARLTCFFHKRRTFDSWDHP